MQAALSSMSSELKKVPVPLPPEPVQPWVKYGVNKPPPPVFVSFLRFSIGKNSRLVPKIVFEDFAFFAFDQASSSWQSCSSQSTPVEAGLH